MIYLGSKNRIWKHLAPIILQERGDRVYLEPFVGGCNSIDKVEGKRVGCDVNPYLIAMWKALQQGWIPPQHVTRDEYAQYRKTYLESPDKALIGWIAFQCSFRGKWFGGYAGEILSKDGGIRNYQEEHRANTFKQLEKLKGVEFHHRSFLDTDILDVDPMVIYCDPPYAGTTEYKDSFNHITFWDWARVAVELNHKVFVSEYKAPADFVSVWDMELKNHMSVTNSQGGVKIATERLFVHKSQVKEVDRYGIA